MDIVILAVLVFIVGVALGWSMSAGYYAGLVRRAFGLGDEIVVRGWLHTKAVKRKIDGRESSR